METVWGVPSPRRRGRLVPGERVRETARTGRRLQSPPLRAGITCNDLGQDTDPEKGEEGGGQVCASVWGTEAVHAARTARSIVQAATESLHFSGSSSGPGPARYAGQVRQVQAHAMYSAHLTPSARDTCPTRKNNDGENKKTLQKHCLRPRPTPGSAHRASPARRDIRARRHAFYSRRRWRCC